MTMNKLFQHQVEMLETTTAQFDMVMNAIKHNTTIKHYHYGDDKEGSEDDSDDDNNDDGNDDNNDDGNEGKQDDANDDGNEGKQDDANDDNNDDGNEGSQDDKGETYEISLGYVGPSSGFTKPITISADQSDTIQTMKAKMVACANSKGFTTDTFNVIRNGKFMDHEPWRRVAEYGFTGKWSYAVRLCGGGKRARAVTFGLQDDHVRDDDHNVVKKCFEFQAPSFKNWIAKLGPADLDNMARIVKSYKTTPDKIPGHAASLVAEMIELEAWALKNAVFYRVNSYS
jgi:hypothetical protein